MKKLLSFFAAAAAMTTIAVQAQDVISVQYTATGSPQIGSNTAGVVPVSGWNYDLSGAALSNLKDENGVSTGISMSTTMPYGVYKQQYGFTGGDTGDSDLFTTGALSTSSSPVVLTLSGLNPADTYSLITYTMSNTQSAVEGTLTGGATYWLKNGAYNDCTYTEGLATTSATAVTGDYFEYTNITGVTTLTYSISNQGGAFGDMPGFQLIETVPEPSTYAMMIGGLGMLITSRRFRRRTL